MFGNFAPFISAPAELSKPPKSVPPPTPVNFPRYQQTPEGLGDASGLPKSPLTSVLQGIIRPADVTTDHLEALGVQVRSDAPIHEVIPRLEALPDFGSWDALTRDECHARNEATRSLLSNGNQSPGCLVYLDRKRELSISNSAAFRAVRRIQPAKGQNQARLGNSYEFFRFLEMFAAFWDDTSRPTRAPEQHQSEDGTGADATLSDSNTSTDSSSEGTQISPDAPVTYRTCSGHQMPPEFRQNILTAFLKLVTYDFGCNVSAPRIEPRLYLTSTTPSATGGESQTRRSHFASGCKFVFRTPTTRDAARAGIVEGPVAAVSARHTTAFPSSPHARSAPSAPTTQPSSSTDVSTTTSPSSKTKHVPERETITDLSRELVAALVTAQYRARQHKTETRIGENAWWATRPRWGGGTGGPIGREIDMLTSTDEVLVGDKDAAPSPESPPEISILAAGSSLVSPYPSTSRPGVIPSRLAALNNAMIPNTENDSNDTVVSPKGTKRLKKGGTTLPMYDNYRMIRPPSSNWDKKVRYEAIGRVPGVDYDDVFVMSSLFHHISVMRVRVPDRLLEVLDGAEETEPLSWGGLMVWRSRWFDFFVPEDRVEAMKTVWGVMSWVMRSVGDGKES